MSLVSVEQAIADFRAGKMVILVDDENRENEGDLCIPAEMASPEATQFLIQHTSGILCLALSGEIVDQLQLPMMVAENRNRFETAFTVSIEARDGVTTGVSAFDRARTIAVAIDPNSQADDLSSPGHVFPLRARDGGVFARAGHTEASVDLARLAGFREAAVISEIMGDNGHMARLPELQTFAEQHQINMLSIQDLIQYRTQHDNVQQRVSSANIPVSSEQQFQMHVYEDQVSQAQTVVMQHGQLDTSKPVLVRLHSECLTGDVFGSKRCDCGEQLDTAMQDIAAQNGVLIYLRQEGRGIGLANKIKAYALQEQGMDTVEANHQLGFPADARDYSIAAQILHQLGVRQIRLLTNNPQKIESLAELGIDVVSREALQTQPTQDNIRYLQTKQSKLNHMFDNLQEQS